MSHKTLAEACENAAIDYQVKMDEIAKEQIFLQKYTPVREIHHYCDEDMSVQNKQPDYEKED